MNKRPATTVDPRPVQRSRLSELLSSPITISDDDDQQPHGLRRRKEAQQQRRRREVQERAHRETQHQCSLEIQQRTLNIQQQQRALEIQQQRTLDIQRQYELEIQRQYELESQRQRALEIQREFQQQQRHREMSPVNIHRGVGTMRMWSPVQQHLINNYYMYNGVYICPSCNAIVSSQVDFMCKHSMANGFTRRKRDVYVERKLQFYTNLINKQVTHLLYVSII